MTGIYPRTKTITSRVSSPPHDVAVLVVHDYIYPPVLNDGAAGVSPIHNMNVGRTQIPRSILRVCRGASRLYRDYCTVVNCFI